MSGGCKRIGYYALLLFISLFVWSIGLSNAQKVKQVDHAVELRYDKSQITMNQLEQILRTEAEAKEKTTDGIVAWEQTKENDLKNEVLQTSTKVDSLKVYGDIGGLIPINKLVGEMLSIGDEEGMIITKSIAYELWGSEDVIGKRVLFSDKDYMVRGVLDEETPLMIVQAVGEKEEAIFSALRVTFRDNENILEQVEHFRNKYGLPQAVIVDLSLMSIVLSQIVYLPGWMIGFWMLGKLCKLIYEMYEYWLACIILCLITLGIGWMMLEIMQISIEIPSHLIPNRWSDFEFWSRVFAELSERSRDVKSLPTLIPDLWRWESIQVLLISAGVTSIGFIMIIKQITANNLDELFWIVLIGIVISFVVIVLGSMMGMSVVTTKAFWLIVPACMGIKFISCQWKEIFK